MTKRRLYLNNEPWQEALNNFLQKLNQRQLLVPGEPQLVPVEEALGRVTAEPVFAKVSSPHYPAAAMDGVAVKAENTYGASDTAPLRLLLGSEAFEVDTGDPLPPGCDAVIMAEDLHYPGDGTVEIISAASPWQHVRPIGEDLVATEMILPANFAVRPYDIGGCLAGGVTEILVHPKPKVVLIPTGTELVQPGTALKPGDIVEYNSKVLGALVQEWGGEPIYFPVIADEYDALKAALKRAVQEADLVIINAGSSAGREDFTHAVISELGELFTHGLAIKPGKPAMLGIVHEKPVIGIPGYPVSAVLTFELLAKPLLYAKLNLVPQEREKVFATLTRKTTSPLGVEEFVRVTLGQVGNKLMVTPVSRGAGVITSLIKADAILRIPALCEGFHAGQEVEVELLRPRKIIERTVVAMGSHDLALDILANELQKLSPGYRLASANVGSLGGIMALKRGEAHLAGMHLLDEITGEYNVSYLERYLPQEELVLVNLVYREQGLLVPRGNPKGIRGLADVAERKLQFINRQPGSGTRILLDYLLKKQHIQPTQLLGYAREEYTHLAVAAAVAAGSADAGMGVAAAAKAFDLDFIPLTKERYDLCVPRKFWESALLDSLKQALFSEEFRRRVAGMGGYDLSDSGKIVWTSACR